MQKLLNENGMSTSKNKYYLRFFQKEIGVSSGFSFPLNHLPTTISCGNETPMLAGSSN